MTFKFVTLLLFGVIFAVNGRTYTGRGRGREGCPNTPINCFVNPCDVETCPAVQGAVCINDDPCNPGCVGNFYVWDQRISRLRKLSPEECQGIGRY